MAAERRIQENIEAGSFGFAAIYTCPPPDVMAASIEFFVAEAISVDGSGTRFYQRAGAADPLDNMTPDPVVAERFVAGTVKFDGSLHLYVGDDEGYLYLNVSDVGALSEVLAAVCVRCAALMKESGASVDSHFEPK